MSKKIHAMIVSLCTVFAVALLAAGTAGAAENPFSVPASTGVQIADSHKCQAGKCQAGKCKGAPELKCEAGKCQSGKCKGAASKCGGMSAERKAEVKAMCAEKVRSGFCGAGKCGGGKCGESLKETCAKMIEGKCGEGKCGGAKKCGGEKKCAANKCGAK